MREERPTGLLLPSRLEHATAKHVEDRRLQDVAMTALGALPKDNGGNQKVRANVG